MNRTSNMDSPYRGLSPYTEADYAYFFGREQESAIIAANLEVSRLTLFYGPSGVGKSSVLRAGVIHSLRTRAQENFAATGTPVIIPVYYSHWQQNPAAGLRDAIEGAVSPFLAEDTDADKQSVLHATTSDNLLIELEAWSKATESDILLVLDQFEEYFQYQVPNIHIWNPNDFGAQLVQIINHSSLRVHVLLSLREDSLARLDYFEGRIPSLLDNRLSLDRLTLAAGREAIERPLAQYSQDVGENYTIEPALVEMVLDQLRRDQDEGDTQPSSLAELVEASSPLRQAQGAKFEQAQIETPYLQLVMTRLWEEAQRQGSQILLQETLEIVGDARSIVARYLDETLAELSPAQQAMADRCFDRLVTPSGHKFALSRTDLIRYAEAEEEGVDELLQFLLRQRILQDVPAAPENPHYEITHDVLGLAILGWRERYEAEEVQRQELAQEQEARQLAEEQARVAQERTGLEAEARQQAQARAEAEAQRVQLARWAMGGLSLLLVLLGTTIS